MEDDTLYAAIAGGANGAERSSPYVAAAAPKPATPAVTVAPGRPTIQVRYVGNGTDPSDNLYIRGLPASTSQDDVNFMFTSIGLTVVRSRVIADTRGTGFVAAMVQLRTADEAAAAIQHLNGQAIPQRTQSKPGAEMMRPDAGRISTLGVKFAGLEQLESDNLFVTGLPASTDEKTLNKTFENLGLTVKQSKMIPDTRGMGVCTAMVQVASLEEARFAIDSLDGQEVQHPEQTFPQTVAAASEAVKATAAAIEAAQRAEAEALNNLLQSNILQTSGMPTYKTVTIKYAGAAQTPSENIIMTGLPTSGFTEEKLREPFDLLEVTVKRSRIIPLDGGGYAAMVQLESQKEAAQAIKALNGQAIFLEPARPAPLLPSVDLAATDLAALLPLKPSPGPAELVPPGGGQVVSPTFAGVPATPAAPSAIVPHVPPAASPTFAGVLATQAAPAAIAPHVPPAASPTFAGVLATQAAPEAIVPHVPPAAPSSDNQASSISVKYAGNEGIPSVNLYIDGLPADMDQASLESMFTSNCMTVVQSRLFRSSQASQRNTCAATIQLGSLEEAAAAVFAFNVTDDPADGGKAVEQPHPQASVSSTPKPSSGKLVLKYAGEDPSIPSDTLYVIGLPSACTQEALRSLFSGYSARVVRSSIIPDTRGRGYTAAMVQLSSLKESANAIAMLSGYPTSALLELTQVKQISSTPPLMGQAVPPPVVAPPPRHGQYLVVKYAGDQTPKENLYLTGLPLDMSDESLRNTFATIGLTVIRCRNIPDNRGTGRGAAMVQVASLEEAASAIAKLNGQSVGGVNNSNGHTPAPVPPPSRQALVGFITVKYAGADQRPSDNIYVTGIPGSSVGEYTLQHMFSSKGLQVVRCRCIPDTRNTGMCAGMVQLGSQEQAAMAIQILNGSEVNLGA